MVLTDEEIERLLNLPKPWVGRLRISLKIENAYKRAEKVFENGEFFKMFVRQAVNDPLDFSVGLVYKDRSTGEELILLRCNGASHNHGNRIERDKTGFVCHIHRATKRYMERYGKPDKWAYPTTAYTDLETALDHFADLVNVSPKPMLKEPRAEMPLFENPC